jgi:hypothetical protein
MSLERKNLEAPKYCQTLPHGVYPGIFRASGVITYLARGLRLPPSYDEHSEEINNQEAFYKGAQI